MDIDGFLCGFFFEDVGLNGGAGSYSSVASKGKLLRVVEVPLERDLV